MIEMTSRDKKVLKEQVREVLKELLAEAAGTKLPPLKKGKLSDLLDLEDGEKVGDLSQKTIASRLGSLISDDSLKYSKAIEMLNAVQVLQKRRDPKFANLMKDAMDILKNKFEPKKENRR